MSIVIRVGMVGRACITIHFRNSWVSGGDLFVAINLKGPRKTIAITAMIKPAGEDSLC